MSLSVISLNEAYRIIDLYSEVILNREENNYNPICFSALQRYDFCDLDNALKVQLAFIVFKKRNKIADAEFYRLASENDATLLLASNTFAPDNIVQQLIKIDESDPDYIIKKIDLLRDNSKNEAFTKLAQTEMHKSFLDYCLSFEESDSSYWENIFDRIGVSLDTNDDSDEILYIVKNKHLFFRSFLKEIEEKVVIEEDLPSYTKPSFYQRNIETFKLLFIIIIMSLGLVNPILRIGVFSLLIIIGIIQFYFWIKESPIENKLGFVLNIVYIIIYFVGIIKTDYGFYILFITIVLWTIDLIRKRLFKSKL
jgi:hypothetical protein